METLTLPVKVCGMGVTLGRSPDVQSTQICWLPYSVRNVVHVSTCLGWRSCTCTCRCHPRKSGSVFSAGHTTRPTGLFCFLTSLDLNGTNPIVRKRVGPSFRRCQSTRLSSFVKGTSWFPKTRPNAFSLFLKSDVIVVQLLEGSGEGDTVYFTGQLAPTPSFHNLVVFFRMCGFSSLPCLQ